MIHGNGRRIAMGWADRFGRLHVGRGERERRGAEGRFDRSFLVERPWCGRPVVPASPEARGADARCASQSQGP
jgi:hypothetical protein